MREDSDTRLLELIGHLYDAAADPRLWSGMASRIAGAFGSTSTVIKLHGGSARFRLLETTENLTVPDRLHGWAEDWHRRDLWVERSVAFGPSRVVTGDALVTPEEQRRSGFYQEWLRQLDIHHMVGAVFPVGDGAIGVIGIHRPLGASAFHEGEQRRVARLLPHLRRALEIGQRLADAALVQAASLEAMDRLDTGLLVLDQAGRILHANAEAEAILAAGAGLGLRHGRLVATSPTVQARLEALLRAPHRAPLGIPRAERPPLTLTTAPMRPGRMPYASLRPLVLAFLRDPERGGPRAELLGELFGLTRAEAGIAASLGTGRSLEEAARRQGIGSGTARWHLKSILAKTGTRRQAELVALLARSVATLP